MLAKVRLAKFLFSGSHREHAKQIVFPVRGFITMLRMFQVKMRIWL